MPVYEHHCRDCDTRTTQERSVDRAFEYPPCPQCGREMPRAWLGTGLASPLGLVSREYLAASQGALPHEMERAHRDEKGNWQYPTAGGKLRQLNPPGFDLHPKTGDVIVRNNRGEKKRYLKTCGLREIR